MLLDHTRRAFVGITALSSTQILGANDRLRGGVIGLGNRGVYLAEAFKEIGAEVSAVCDVYEPRLAAGLKSASTGAKAHDNYKQMLDDKSLDFVIIATPDHWHAQMAVDAADAGKDIYVEKPMALNRHDAARMVEAVRRNGRILQVGSQRRSSAICEEAREIVSSGSLGPVRLVNCWWNGKLGTRTGTPLSNRKLEGALDWKQWLGPAPPRDLDPQRFFSWIWFWEYGGGYMVGQTVHILDATHMFMNPSPPIAVTALGKSSQQGGEIPETTSFSVEYPEYLGVFTVGYKAMRYNPPEMSHEMKQVNGWDGRLDVGRETLTAYNEDPEAVVMKPRIERRAYGEIERAVRKHIRNFMDCMRSRKEPNAPVETGQACTLVLSMAVDSLRTGQTIRYNASTGQVENGA